MPLNLSGKAMLAGVMGHPVAHSLSPRLHNYWIAQAGLDAVYIPLAVSPEEVREAFRLLPKMGFRGWNVTVPHKETAFQQVDIRSESAIATGAVNTVYVQEDGSLRGDNTDIYGFISNLKSQAGDLSPYRARALIIGAGGAARAVAQGLHQEGFSEIIIVNRTMSRAEALSASMPHANPRPLAWEKLPHALEETALLVNTTTLGMQGHPPLDVPLEALPKSALVADIVYTPLMTPLLSAAKARGNPIVTGLGMLIHQAIPGFQGWFGVTPAPDKGLEVFLLTDT